MKGAPHQNDLHKLEQFGNTLKRRNNQIPTRLSTQHPQKETSQKKERYIRIKKTLQKKYHKIKYSINELIHFWTQKKSIKPKNITRPENQKKTTHLQYHLTEKKYHLRNTTILIRKHKKINPLYKQNNSKIKTTNTEQHRKYSPTSSIFDISLND